MTTAAISPALEALHATAAATTAPTKAAATRAINAERVAIEAVAIEAMPMSSERTEAAQKLHAATRDLQSARSWVQRGQLYNAAFRVASAARHRQAAEALVRG